MMENNSNTFVLFGAVSILRGPRSLPKRGLWGSPGGPFGLLLGPSLGASWAPPGTLLAGSWGIPWGPPGALRVALGAPFGVPFWGTQKALQGPSADPPK